MIASITYININYTKRLNVQEKLVRIFSYILVAFHYFDICH